MKRIVHVRSDKIDILPRPHRYPSVLFRVITLFSVLIFIIIIFAGTATIFSYQSLRVSKSHPNMAHAIIRKPTPSPTLVLMHNPTLHQIPTPTPTPTSTPVPVVRTLTSLQTQSQTVNATGMGLITGTQASGTACIDNFDTANSITLQSGSTYSNTYSSIDIHMVLDATVTVPPAPSTTTWSQKCIPGHILEVGSIGNNEFNSNITGSLSWSVFNNPPFSNGQDPHAYSAVQQSDIDNAAAPLKNSTTQAAIADINSQLHPNEHLVGTPQCTSNVSSDHNAGDLAMKVTVTVQTTCIARAST